MVKIGMPLGLTEIMSGVLGRQLGAEALQAGNYQDAVVHLSNAINVVQDAQGKAEARTLLGYCELKLGHIERAREVLLAAAPALANARGEFDSRLPSLMAMKHASELPEDANDELERTYQIVVALGHSEYVPKANLNLGTIEYNVKGRPQVAKELWEQACRDAPPGSSIQALAFYNLGWYWDNKRDPQRARRYYQEARNMWPTDRELPDRLRHLDEI